MTTGKLLATAGILLALVSLSFLPAAAQSYTVTDLGTLGGRITNAAAINDHGVVSGYSMLPSGIRRAFVWSSALGIHDIGTFQGGSESVATGINNSSEVVGWGAYASGAAHAALWKPGSRVQDLGTL